MILIAGRDLGLIGALTERLSQAGRDFAWTEPDALFERAFQTKAEAIVLLETPPVTSRDDQVLRDALAAMNAPGPRKTFVLVTPRTDAALDAVRRDGAPYVVLRAPNVLALDGVARGRTVVVARDVLRETRDMVDADSVARAVMRALDDETLVGRVVELSPPQVGALVRAIERAGARARVTSSVVARAASLFLFGPTVELDREGRPFVASPS